MKLHTRIGSGLSRLWNVIRYPGRWRKWTVTTSARHYLESHLAPYEDRASWRRGMARIDRVMRWFDRNPARHPHCEWAAHEKERDGLKWRDDMQRIRELKARGSANERD